MSVEAANLKKKMNRLNPFLPGVRFIYPLETSENISFLFSRGYRDGTFGTKKLK